MDKEEINRVLHKVLGDNPVTTEEATVLLQKALIKNLLQTISNLKEDIDELTHINLGFAEQTDDLSRRLTEARRGMGG